MFAVNAVIAAQIKKNQIKLEKDFIAIDLSDAAGDDNGKLKFVLLFLPVPEACTLWCESAQSKGLRFEFSSKIWAS